MKAERKKVEPLVKMARGQLDAVLKMIDDNRYCMDIVTQMLAAEALLRKARQAVVKGHLEGCVQDAIASGTTEERAQKLDEIIRLLEKMEK
ncbi:MAG: metal-sensing transcriptional repressor [Clostridiaceae bacterium]|nr:metal-sensing transcriptional repressor [Clostridiaceae bacterium]